MEQWPRGDLGEHLPDIHQLNAGKVSRRRLRGAGYERPFRNAYVIAGALDDPHALIAAALASVGEVAAASHTTAAYVLGMPLPPGQDGLDPVHVTIPRGRRLRSQPGLAVHTGEVHACIAERFGIAVTNVVATWLDLATICKLSEMVAITDAIGKRRLATRAHLEHGLAKYAGRKGVGAARQALALSDFKAASWWESEARLIFYAADLPVVPQLKVCDAYGVFIARLDFGNEECKVGIEYDGAYHLKPAQQRKDVRRVQALQREGWLILRYTYEDLAQNPSRLAAEVRSALEARRHV